VGRGEPLNLLIHPVHNCARDSNRRPGKLWQAPAVLRNPVRARRGDASALFPEGESDAHAPRPARTHAHHPPVCRMESVSPSMERRVKSRDDRHIHYPFGCPCVCVRVINVDRPWRRAQRC